MADTRTKKRIGELFKALKKKNKYVAKLCEGQSPQDPLQTISNNYNNTFLHMAIRFRQKDLVKELVEMLPKEGKDPLSDKTNMEGNTILHEIATRGDMKDVAEKVVKSYKDKDPKLLIARNNLGETPVFCAARYGLTEMFEFLAEKMNLKEGSEEEVKQHLQRDDKTTVLHICITTECFELANYIAKNYRYLITEKDQNSMTALQYLACNRIAFDRKKMKMIQEFEELFRSIGFWSDSWRRRCPLQELVKLLVEKDTSWHQAKDGQESQENEGQNSNKSKKSDVSPLFLATISNIQEIIEEILVQHPHTLDHTNNEGMNILQVAIHYRRIKIFDVLIKSQLLPRSLFWTIDNKGNSLLHMFGEKMHSQVGENMQNPAFELQKELSFFQDVKLACKTHKPLNNNHQTAEEIFAIKNEELRGRAKEWLMRTTENCTILSVFIATVAFGAAYTVPGGSDQNTGFPILHSKPLFVLFILTDVISVTFALISMVIFLSILTSSFSLHQFQMYLFKKLIDGIKCMILSISMMATAFGVAIALIMEHNWNNAVEVVVGLLLGLLLSLLYSSLGSEILGSGIVLFKKIVANVVAEVLFLLLIPYEAFKGLRWTVKKAFEFIIRKPVRCICGNKSNTQSDTQV